MTPSVRALEPGTAHPLQPLQEPGGGDAEQAEDDHAREDLTGVEELERFPEEEAQARFGRLDLCDEDEDEGHARAQTQSREDVGESAGQDDFGEDLDARGP